MMMSKKEAAEWWSVSERTIDRWRKRGLLTAVPAGGVVRFHEKEVRGLVFARRVTRKPPRA